MASDHQEEGLLGWLDGPRLVVGAFAFFVLALTAFGVVLWADQREHTEKLDAIITQRVIEERAAKRAQVETCFARAAQGPALLRVLHALELELDDPTGRQRIRNFREFSELNTPTVRECRQLADHLNVRVPKGVR